MKSAEFMTTNVFDQVLFQYGADEELLRDDAVIETTKGSIQVEIQKYGLLVLASILGSLSSWYVLFRFRINH
jgi:hypothetical protein